MFSRTGIKRGEVSGIVARRGSSGRGAGDGESQGGQSKSYQVRYRNGRGQEFDLAPTHVHTCRWPPEVASERAAAAQDALRLAACSFPRALGRTEARR